GGADGDQDFQRVRHDVRRQDSMHPAYAFLHRISLSIFDRGPDRHDAGRRPVELAAHRLILRRGALSLHARRWIPLRYVRRLLLLVPKSRGAFTRPAARALAFLVVYDRISRDVRHDAHPGAARHAATHFHLWRWAR